MSILSKIALSIVPSISIILFFIIINHPIGIISGWHVLISNFLLLIQTIFLYRKMKLTKISKETRILYTVFLITILPFHFVLIWKILPKSK
jgi:hypothetical protein